MNRFGIFNLLAAISLITGVRAACVPERWELSYCCPHELVSKEIAEKCKGFLDLDAVTDPPNKGHKCYMECVLNATEIMNGYDVDEDKLKTYLSSVLSEIPELIPVMEAAFIKCAEFDKEVRKAHAMRQSSLLIPDVLPENPCSSLLLDCVEMETAGNCPPSALRKDDDSCKANMKK